MNDEQEQKLEAREERSTWALVRATWTLVGVTVLLGISGGIQAWATIRALGDSHDAFVQSERPFALAAVPRIFPVSEQSTETLRADVFQTNYGKTPATHLRMMHKMYLEPPEDVADAYFRALDSGSIPEDKEETTLPPGTTPLAYITAISEPLTADQVKEILSTDHAITIVGRIRYQDLAGNPYRTDYCFTRLASGAVNICATHNDVR